jgi:integrase
VFPLRLRIKRTAPCTVAGSIDAARDEADLGLRHAGLHVLRHSAAARMIEAAAAPKADQAVLGHRSAALTR